MLEEWPIARFSLPLQQYLSDFPNKFVIRFVGHRSILFRRLHRRIQHVSLVLPDMLVDVHDHRRRAVPH